jgi:3-methyladenine DNA glycosylase AlkD
MDCESILCLIRSLGNPDAVAGMARYGINPATACGVSIPNLRNIAAKNRKNHLLAEELWASGIHEARILASMIADPRFLTEEQMDRWVMDFNSWDLCDQCCNNLFRKWPQAHDKAREWSLRDGEFIRRAGFVLMACLAVHDKKSPDEVFLNYLPEIVRASADTRNFVKKAVNWALRQIGKKNRILNAAAIVTAEQIQQMDSKAAKWIAADAMQELSSEAVRKRLGAR